MAQANREIEDGLQREVADQRQRDALQKLEELEREQEKTNEQVEEQRRLLEEQQRLLEGQHRILNRPKCEERIRSSLGELWRESVMADRLVATYCD